MTAQTHGSTAPGEVRQTRVLAAGLALAFMIVGSIIGATTGPQTDGWYADLRKSVANPPGWVFGVVWPVLYILMGVSTALLWMVRRHPVARAALGIMAVHLVLNYAWAFVFFDLHLIGLAFWWIVAVALLVAALVVLASRVRPPAAWLLLPYLAWLAFAAYLSGTIMALN